MSLKLISSGASFLTEDCLPLSVFTWSSLYTCVCMPVQSWPPLCCPMVCSCLAPPSMEFSRQEYWSGLPLPTPGDLPDPGMKPTTLASPTLTKGVFTTDVTWEALSVSWSLIKTSFRRLGLQLMIFFSLDDLFKHAISKYRHILMYWGLGIQHSILGGSNWAHTNYNKKM